MNATLAAPAEQLTREWSTGYLNDPAEATMTTRLTTRLASVTTMLILFGPVGCDVADGAWSEYTPERSPAEAGGKEMPVATQPPPPLELSLEAPREIPAGEPIPFRLILRNRGMDPIQVELGGEPITFDLLVTREEDGAEVWRRMEGYATEDILKIVTVPPGDSVVFADVWSSIGNDRRWVTAGRYRLRGILPVVGIPEGWTTEERAMVIE